MIGSSRFCVRSGERGEALIVYFDTSALVKLVFDEPGSELAAELWDRAEAVVSSQLIYPEARAAVASAHRQGRVDGDLAEIHGLRGYDAVHLATALGVNAASLLVATWDRELARGAIEAGCSVSPPSTA